MIEFLKTFGYGFLYFIGLPFICVGLVFYGIYLLLMFIYLSIKGIILFFRGKKLDMILPEDQKAEEIFLARINNRDNQVLRSQAAMANAGVTYNTINQFNVNNEGDLSKAIHQANMLNNIDDEPRVINNNREEIN